MASDFEQAAGVEANFEPAIIEFSELLCDVKMELTGGIRDIGIEAKADIFRRLLERAKRTVGKFLQAEARRSPSKKGIEFEVRHTIEAPLNGLGAAFFGPDQIIGFAPEEAVWLN